MNILCGKYVAFFIIIIIQRPKSLPTGSARFNVKEKEKKERLVRRAREMKGIEALRVKQPTTFRSIDALIGEEEENGKQKRTKRKKHGALPNQSP